MNQVFLTFLFISIFIPASLKSQLLFSENFVVLLDSTKNFKGAFSPDLDIQTQRRLLVEVNSTADLAFRIKNNSLIIAQSIEFTALGGERAVDDAYLFAKFKANKNKNWMPEYFVLWQRANARGLALQAATGINIRHAFFRARKGGVFLGLGTFWEHERWNYNGVEENLRPPILERIENDKLKVNAYLSYKRWLSKKLFLDASFYYQSAWAELFQAPRIGSSMGISWQIKPYLQVLTEFQGIYDAQPVVPINKYFQHFNIAFALTF